MSKTQSSIISDNELYSFNKGGSGSCHILYDLANWKNGLAFKNIDFSPTGKPVIKIAELNDGIGPTTAYTEKEYPKEVYLQKGDFLFSWSGNPQTSIDIYKFRMQEGWLNQHIFKVIPNEKLVHRDFFFYLMKALKPNFTKIATNKQTTGLGHVTIADLKRLEVTIPDYNKQKKIAQILLSLDEKIELNNAINRNLEEQAQILFKNYEENKPSNLMKIADVAEINPDSFGLKDNRSFVNYLDTSSITQNVISELQYINLNEEKLPSRAKRKVVENDIVYSTVRPNQLHFGFINEVKPNMLVSTGFAVIRSKNPLVSNEYIYLNLTKRDTIEKLQQIAEQSVSTFPAIKPSDIGDCLINVFEKKDAEILNNQLSAVFKKISQNNQENQRLTLIRDTLLPKLMSGEMELGC